MAATLAALLRYSLVQVSAVTALNISKEERIEALYRYVTGPEFRHRVEAIRDSYRGLQDELEKEKRWFAQKWAREEQLIRGVLDNAVGLYGDFEGLNGTRFPALEDGEPDEMAS